jgi:hypothetical protein
LAQQNGNGEDSILLSKQYLGGFDKEIKIVKHIENKKTNCLVLIPKPFK